MLASEFTNRIEWSSGPTLMGWIANSRLDHLMAPIGALKPTDTEELAALQRYFDNLAPALTNLQRLLAEVS